MNNLQQPAFPFINEEDGHYENRETYTGFTKLEYAALLIAQGICSETIDRGTGYIATRSVEIAKAVLEEANK